MTNSAIKKILVDKEIKHLYHANTVMTACIFLENGGLLSRGYVEENGLRQTSQGSDSKDKLMDVFDDIFFDSIDIHQKVCNLNYYGPVSFVYSIDLIDELAQGQLWITKGNPAYWNIGMTEAQKYFLEEDELAFFFNKDVFSQHITIRNQQGPLPFNYLEKIIIDDPGETDTHYFENAYEHLEDLIKRYAEGTPLEVRTCLPGCRCKEQYQSYKQGYLYYRFGF